jgi:ribose-phosphate pyrophosphokinase
MKLFGLNDSRAYAERIADRLGVPLASHEERNFEDGEFKIRPLEQVRAKPVIVCQSLEADGARSASDKLCRLLFFVGALKDAGAAHITAVVPYLAFWRKDRRTKPRDPVTTRYVARLLEAVGVDAIASLDVHSPAAFDNAFGVGKEHFTAAPLFAEHFAPVARGAAKLVVLSPDAGGIGRAQTFAALLAERAGRPVGAAFVEKHRSEGRVSGELFAGDVDGATVIVYDDLIATGTTIARAAAACAARGARSIHAAATHAVLTPGAASVLAQARLDSLVVCDSVGDVRRRCEGVRAPLHVLDSTQIFASAIERWRADGADFEPSASRIE